MRNDPVLFQFPGLFGYDVSVKQSALWLIALLAMFGLGGDITWMILSVVVILGSIFLHEMGHAWACKVQGIPVREVAIHGGGGYVLPARSMNRREDEFVTAMGPIVNLTLWALASMLEPHLGYGLLGDAVWLIGRVNLFLGIFNLMPMLPLDGGRLTSLVLLRVMPREGAMRTAGFIGVVASLLWIGYFFGHFLFGWGAVVLLFLPQIGRHWQMMTEGA